MPHFPALVSLIKKSCLYQPTCVFGNGFDVSIEPARDFVECHAVMTINEEQDVEAPVVRRPLEITFQYF